MPHLRNVLRLENVSRHVNGTPIYWPATIFSRKRCRSSDDATRGPPYLVFPPLQQVAGLRIRPGFNFPSPVHYAVFGLPKKPLPKRIYPPKLKRKDQLARGVISRDTAHNSWSADDGIMRQLSNEELEKELTWLANNNPALSRIKDILHELVVERDALLNITHYEAMILSNCNPQLGSVSNIETIMKEMKEAEIPMSATAYNAVLRVLAVHPDTKLREHILSEMQKYWMEISPAELRSVVIASMIRGGQLELAQEKMKEVRKAPKWWYVLLVHALCDRGDFDAVLYLLYDLQDKSYSIPRPTRLHILWQASKHKHFDLTMRIWMFHVEPMYIIPDVDCCVKVLELASEKASPKLAESAMAVIEDRYPEVVEAQKVLLSQTYSNAGEVPDPQRYRRGNMFTLLSQKKGHHQGFFDPTIALRKRLLPRFVNPRRLEQTRKQKEKQKLNLNSPR